MIEINNFFIKICRAERHIRGGSGGSDLNTAFHKGWRKLIEEPARARVFLRAGSSGKVKITAGTKMSCSAMGLRGVRNDFKIEIKTLDFLIIHSIKAGAPREFFAPAFPKKEQQRMKGE